MPVEIEQVATFIGVALVIAAIVLIIEGLS